MPSGIRLRPGHVLAAAIAIAPVLAAVAPLGLAPLFVISAAASLFIGLRCRTLYSPSLFLVVFGCAMIVWGTMTGFWSIDSATTWKFIPRFVVELVCGIVLLLTALRLDREGRELFERWLLIGFAIGTTLFAIEILTSGTISESLRLMVGREPREFTAASLNRGSATLAAFAFPAALAIYRRYGPMTAIGCLILVLVIMHGVQGEKAILGLVAGGAVALLTLLVRQRFAAIMAALLVLLVLTGPLHSSILASIPGPWTTSESPSVRHRLLIWRFVSDRIYERPVIGWGLDASRTMPGGKDGPMTGTELLPLHPHNVLLQLWLELGGIGIVILSAGLAAGVLKLRRILPEPAHLAFALGGVAAAAAMASIGYGAWQTWWLSSLWLCGISLAALGTGSARTSPTDSHDP